MSHFLNPKQNKTAEFKKRQTIISVISEQRKMELNESDHTSQQGDSREAAAPASCAAHECIIFTVLLRGNQLGNSDVQMDHSS